MADLTSSLSRTIDQDFVFYDQRYKVRDTRLEELVNSYQLSSKMTTQEEKILLRGLYRGIGVHHRGVPKPYLELVEHLFRLRHLQVVVAGSTLALGINMPCKSVVFAGDDLSLVPLEFRQMSGRAGRRGYDSMGHVVFWGVSKAKVDRLLTSSLPSIQGGQCSFSATMALQSYHMATKDAEKNAPKENSRDLRPGPTENAGDVPGDVVETFLRRYLACPMMALGRTEDNPAASLLSLSSAHFRLLGEVLVRIGAVDPRSGCPTLYGRLALDVPSQDPATLVVGHLCRAGWLDLLCSSYDSQPDVTLKDLVLVLAHFIQPRYLPRHDEGDLEEESSALGRDALAACGMQDRRRLVLPPKVQSEMEEYNRMILDIYHRVQQGSYRCPLKEAFCEGALVLAGSLESLGTGVAPRHGGHASDTCDVPRARAPCLLELSLPLYVIPPECIRNPYIYEFYIHGSSGRIWSECRVSEMDLWQDLNEFNNFIKHLYVLVKDHGDVFEECTKRAVKALWHTFFRRFRHMWA